MAIPQYDAAGDLLAWKLEHTAQEVDDTIDGMEDKANQTALEAEQSARQQADQTLQGNIEAEATARTAADNELKSALQEEQAARRAADESVRSEIVNPDWNATSGRAKILNKPHTLEGYGVSEVPAYMLTGMVDIANIPPQTIEHLIVVANDAERFELTTDTVRNGYTVKVQSTGKLYYVVDETKLSQSAGYVEYTAGSASSVPWTGVTGKPDTLAGYGISDAYTSLQGLDSSVATKFLTIRVATIIDQINVELHTVSLTNTDKYPFNNSTVTVALDERRNNLDYSVEAEALSRTGGVESVEVYDKQLNGFKVKFNGSGSAASVRLKITGGIT